MMRKEELVQLARLRAAQFSISSELVCAVVEQESNWDPWAIRYEPAFQSKYVSPLKLRGELKTFGASVETEAITRSCSFGLMQVMGQVARESGLGASFLTEMCDPDRALELGCSHLAKKLEQAQGDVSRALLLWNGGADVGYAKEVLDRASRYR